MKKLTTIIYICGSLLVLGSVAKAAMVWDDVNYPTGNWSNTNSWILNGKPAKRVPTSSDEVQLNNDTVTVDNGNAVCSRLKVGTNTGTNATVVLNTPGAELTVSRSGGPDTQSLNLGYNGQGTINQSAGTLNVINGQVRLGVNSGSYGIYNLSGGLLDTLVLYNTSGQFNATGGTLVIENSGYIRGFGLVSSGGGFYQGGCLLEPAGAGTIGSISIGDIDSGGPVDYIMGNTSSIEFDLGSGNVDPTLSVNDTITSLGNFTIAGELEVNFTATPQYGDKWNVWTIASGYEWTYIGSGTFATIPANIEVNWLDTTGNGNDTLQLEYVPEPATLLLLGLGGIALLKRKSTMA